MIVTIIIIAILFLVGTPLYMKFVVPKMMKKMDESSAEVESEFAEKGPELVDEFITNPNKFGLVKQTLQGGKIYGIYSGTLDKEIKLSDKLKEKIISSITLTSEVDMSMSFLVAAEDGLHYMVFDGKKCIQNEVFDYESINNQKLTSKLYTFEYKGDELKFLVSSTLNFYPRFNVHEVQKSGSGQGRLRVVNDFVREWLAYETTGNAEYNGAVLHKPFIGNLVQGKDFFLDQKIRSTLVEGFKNKLNICITA